MPATTAERPAAAAQPAPDAADPSARYFARVDVHTAQMTPAERLTFLRRDRARWIALEQGFFARVDNGEMPAPGEQAATYTVIIAELGARLARAEAAT